MTHFRWWTNLLLVLMVLSACSQDITLKEVTVGQEFRLKISETATLLDQQDGFLADLLIDDIRDNRCPINADCIRAGEAEVDYSLTGVNEVALSGSMCIGECPHRGSGWIEVDTVSMDLNGTIITLLLKSIDPFPDLNKPNPERSALIVFESYTTVTE